MAFKKITIMFFPDRARTVRQFKFPKALIHFLSLFSLSAVVFISLLFVDYYNLRKQVPEHTRLIEENMQQEAQLAALVDKIGQINSKLIELKELDNRLKVMVNIEPGDDNTQFLGIGGSDLILTDSEYSVEKAHQKLVRLMHQSLDNLDAEIEIQTQEKMELYKFLEEKKSMFACTPSIWPVKGWVSSKFGYRLSPFTNEKEFHEGLDVSARRGTEIVAPADGVVSAIRETYGFGTIITINHGYNLRTRYAHLSKVLVKKGQSVKRGEKIALVGSTGRSTGPHLHYEVELNGVPVDPLNYILN